MLGRRANARLHRRERFDHGAPIAKIDTRPMVFVAMFLAILFLLYGSQIRTHALIIELPRGSNHPDYIVPPYLTVEISAEGRVTLEGTPTQLDALGSRIAGHSLERPVVLVRSDGNAPYRIVAHVLAALSNAGVANHDICFDGKELFEHRHFERINFFLATTIVESEDQNRNWRVPEIPPGGCEQFQIQDPWDTLT